MPIYEYACHDCQHEFEILVRGGEVPSCPQCLGGELVKLFSVPAAHSHNSISACGPEPPPTGCGLPRCGAGRCADS